MNQDESTTGYTAIEQMVVSGARQITDGDVIYVGVGLPTLALLLAKYTHAPHCTVVGETGIIRATAYPLPTALDTLGAQTMADQLASMFYIDALAQAGFATAGFLGGGQIDRYGNVNDTAVGNYYKPVHRWPGSGGGNDIASFCKRTITTLRQSKRRFLEKVEFITCPGYLDGKPRQRETEGLPPNTGPSAVITDLGVYVFENREMVLKTFHASIGVTLDQVKAEVGWDIKVASDLEETAPPTGEELYVLREKVDPEKRWSSGKPTWRPTAD